MCKYDTLVIFRFHSWDSTYHSIIYTSTDYEGIHKYKELINVYE